MVSLLQIPNDILREIFAYCEPKEFRAVKLSCKRLYVLTAEDRFVQNATLLTIHTCHMVFIKKRNIFLTGMGGTGKSYTLRKICEYAPKYNRVHAITAPTGRAACVFEGGQTIHSFSGLKLAKITLEEIVENFKRYKKVPGEKNWQEIDLLIIDEISMLGASLLEKINLCARLSRRENKPFGGIQVIFSGDFLQLLPVLDQLAFTSSIWKQLKFITIEMKIPVRQCDDRNYFYLLNRIRTCTYTERDIKLLKLRLVKYDEDLMIKPTKIYPKNIDVERINQEEFKKIDNRIEISSDAIDMIVERRIRNQSVVYLSSTKMSVMEARKKLEINLLRQCPNLLEFKIDAQYILTINLNVKTGLVNGARCVYLGSGKFMFVRGQIISIKLHEFFFSLSNNLFLKRQQYPLKLGYATTIHSSQGMTLDLAQISLGQDIFDDSMTYVALSRVKSLNALYLTDFDPTKIKASKLALEFYAGNLLDDTVPVSG